MTVTEQTTELCVQWGDFIKNVYITANVQWGAQIGESEDVTAFNGIERRTRRHCTKDGVACVATTMQFYPDFGHADYGHIWFE